MEKTAIEKIIEDTEELLFRAVPAFEAQQKLASLEPEFNQLKDSLSKAAADAAQFFILRGALNEQKRAEFVERLIDNPSDLISVMEKYADNLTVKEVGEPAGKTASLSTGLDPLAAFCMR